MLYLINKSPYKNYDDYSSLTKLVNSEHHLVFLADGVEVAIPNHPWWQQIVELQTTAKLYLVKDDVEQSAISQKLFNCKLFNLIDYKDLVELCVQHSPIISW